MSNQLSSFCSMSTTTTLNSRTLTALCESVDGVEIQKFLEAAFSQKYLNTSKSAALTKPYLTLDDYYTTSPFAFGLSYTLKKGAQELTQEEKKSITQIYHTLKEYLEPESQEVYIRCSVFFPPEGSFNLAQRALVEVDNVENLKFLLSLLQKFGVEVGDAFFSQLAHNRVSLASRCDYSLRRSPANYDRALACWNTCCPNSVYTALDSEAYQRLIISLLGGNERALSAQAANPPAPEESVVLSLIERFFAQGLQLVSVPEPENSFFPGGQPYTVSFMAALGLRCENVEIVKKVACHTQFDVSKTQAQISRVLWQAHRAYKSAGAQFLMRLSQEEVEKYQIEAHFPQITALPNPLAVSLSHSDSEAKVFKI